MAKGTETEIRYEEASHDIELARVQSADSKGEKDVGGIQLKPAEEYEPSLYDGTQRKMEQRHLQMFALAGTIGTGLFLGSGKVLRYGGPLLALLDFALMGTVTWGMMMALGEMAVFAPVSGGWIHHADRWFHPSVGFAVGWLNVLHGFFSTPSELVTASILCSYWDHAFPAAHQAAYITTFLVAMTLLNYFGVRWWGESEFIFACLKIALIVGLIIGGLVIDLGGGPHGDRIGFRYWRDPGPVKAYHAKGSLGYFLAWFRDLVQASYSFTSIEQISIAAAEVKNPRVSVAKAAKRVFWRIMIFYILAILIVTMLVSSNDKALLADTGTAASSPFVLAFERAGVKVLPSIINAVVLSSAFSAGNSGLYAHSRCLYGLALRRQAPRIFAKCDQRGTPYVALGINVAFLAIGYLGISEGAETVLTWLTNVTTLSALMTWIVICATYLRFWQGLRVQGYNRGALRFRAPWMPLPAIWALFWVTIIVVFTGWELFTHGHWNTKTFIVDYISIPVFLALVGLWLVIKPSRWVALKDLDFVSEIPGDEVDIDEPPPTTWYGKLSAFLFT